ncbi:MAG: VOC family protein [Oceanicaulis sp.]
MEFKAKARTCLFLAHQAEEAASFYVGLLPGSEIDAVYRPQPDGPALVVEFTLGGAPFMAMNGNPEPTPSHLTSISVLTEDQAETDRLWAALTAGGEEGRCGWLRDCYGVHWQIVPKALPRLMGEGGATAQLVSGALMKMKKIVIADLEAAARS